MTATELYKISNKPIFISQTPTDKDGNYTMKWRIEDGSIVNTESNLFD